MPTRFSFRSLLILVAGHLWGRFYYRLFRLLPFLSSCAAAHQNTDLAIRPTTFGYGICHRPFPPLAADQGLLPVI